MVKDFKAFVMRGNLVEIAVAFVMGLAFKGVVDAFVDLVTNVVAIPGKTQFAALHFTIGGGVFHWGALVNAVVNFVIVAVVLFVVVVKPMNALLARRQSQPDAEADTKPCPECLSTIPLAARRCAYCTATQ